MLNASLLLNQGNDVSVVASSSSSSMSSASLSSVVREIQCSNELSHDEKDRLELELARMKDAAESKNGRQFSEKLKNALEIAEKASGLIPKILSIAQAASSAF